MQQTKRALSSIPAKPAEIDELVMERVLEIRSKKIRSEINLRKATAVLDEAKKAWQDAVKRSEMVKKQIANLTSLLSQTRKQQTFTAMNLEMMLKLKQGQIEVEQAPVTTRYDDAVLIESRIVESFNAEIRSLSKDKAGILEEIKETKKQIAKKMWERTEDSTCRSRTCM